MIDTGGDVIVNAAAYTAVDQAESDPELADAINGIGAGAVAGAAAAMNVPVIHLSTDYVFDGTADRPYREDDPVSPLGAYGASKLLGEEAVAAEAENYAILRTAWVYSPFGKNFVKTMLRLAGEREELGVVADQYGSPTSALDIADGIIAVSRNLLEQTGRPEPARLVPHDGNGLYQLGGLRRRDLFPLGEVRRPLREGSSHRVSRLPDAGEAPGQFQARLHEAERGTRCHAPTLAPVP